MVVNLRDITERKLFEARLQHQAFHDPLTGLPNRVLFLQTVERELDRGRDTKSAKASFLLTLTPLRPSTTASGTNLATASSPRLAIVSGEHSPMAPRWPAWEATSSRYFSPVSMRRPRPRVSRGWLYRLYPNLSSWTATSPFILPVSGLRPARAGYDRPVTFSVERTSRVQG
jgi:hypothetical protein